MSQTFNCYHIPNPLNKPKNKGEPPLGLAIGLRLPGPEWEWVGKLEVLDQQCIYELRAGNFLLPERVVLANHDVRHEAYMRSIGK